ncbi:class I SAM-dependent methyltransferase [Aestuariibius sp. 2305UL40-4]|uniref:class I SAM-dependent methyltransferase n=1 Tax=Aestuariibius violaceus TaxID=3234132 RepID=UPI00345E312E
MTAMPKSSLAGRCFSDAVLAHAIVLGNRHGILDRIADGSIVIDGACDQSMASKSHIVEAVVRTLWATDAAEVNKENGRVTLTDFGKELYQEREVFALWLDAYSNLLAYWLQPDATTPSDLGSIIKGNVVATSSAAIGSRYLDQDVLSLFRDLKPQGTLCDIGCGNARRLFRLCKEFHLKGIGIDISPGALQAAEPIIAEAKDEGIDLRVEIGDATRIRGSYPDVIIVMQTFMTHHITSDNFCESVLRTYPKIFPSAEYFVFFDTTTSEDKPEAQLFSPGFDYIHRLQDLRPRTRSALLSVFDEAQFDLIKEVNLRVPNSYAWVLKPRGPRG